MKILLSLVISTLLFYSTPTYAEEQVQPLNDGSSIFLWQDVLLVAGNDHDRDGYDDEDDEFPDDPHEHSDLDKDLVGDNRDEFLDDPSERSDHDKDRKGYNGQATATDNVIGSNTISNDAPASYPVGTTTVTWVAADASGNSSSAIQLVVVSPPNLPPDPGPAGELTLEGIDSDNDGVRDDVQRWIALAYPNSQKTREVITQYALAIQAFLLNANNPTISLNNANQSMRSLYCAYYIDPANAGDFTSEVEAKVLNTYLRSKVYLQADRQLSGKFFSTPANLKQGCDFDPDIMAN